MMHYLTTILQSKMKQSPELIPQVKSEIEFFKSKYRRTRKEIGPLETILMFHQLIDRIKKDFQAQEDQANLVAKIQCKRGCGHCCKQVVFIAEDEALLILDYVKKKKIRINETLLKTQLRASDAKEWESLKPSKKKCLFLNSKRECDIYSCRPAACRLYTVLGPSKHCNPIKYPQKKVPMYFCLQTEVIISAIINVTDSGTMPQMLLKNM